MPHCVHCFASVPSLTTKYGEKHIVLAQCPECGRLADPYVERDATTLFIDLLLLRVGVYRHFLWNAQDAVRPLTVLRFALVLTILETYISWSEAVLELPDGSPLPRFERFALFQIIYTLALHAFANLLVDLFRPKALPISLLQPSLALMAASVTKLATLFLALIFRREFLDSSSDLRPVYRFFVQYTPLLASYLPARLHIERSWVLDANGLKDVLVRGGLGATSAVMAYSGMFKLALLQSALSFSAALLDAAIPTSAMALLLAWLPSFALYRLAESYV